MALENKIKITEEIKKRYFDLLSNVLDIKTALDVLILFDDDFLNQRATIWQWQAKLLYKSSKDDITKNHPIRELLVAANGSGKSQCIVSPLATWCCLTQDQSQVVVTTASGQQLDKQSARYIKRICTNANNFFRSYFDFEVFDINTRQIKNIITESYIDLFATDEAGKAEGWHPLKVDGKFMIIVDEAKSVIDDIFDALDRCNGFTHYIMTSSPGDNIGRFYDIFSMDDSPFNLTQITAFECKHISKEHIATQIKLHGEHDPFVRSSIFAEFTSVGKQVVIPREILLQNNKFFIPQPSFGPIRAGLDLSAGGDETVLSVWLGYELIAQECIQCKYTPATIDMIITWFHKYKLKAENVYADDGGIGRSMIDMLYERGWPVNRILNQRAPVDSTRYVNLITELWFNVKRYVEENLIDLNYIVDNGIRRKADNKLIDQLSTRFYKRQNVSGKLILESKEEARKHGHPSPDRADAMVLAWYPYYFDLTKVQELVEVKKDNRYTVIPADEIVEWYNNRVFDNRGKSRDNSNIKDGRYIKPILSEYERQRYFNGETVSKQTVVI